MGILSNPSINQRNIFGRDVAKFMGWICISCYLAGIAWFACLARSDLNRSTYLSENALSPGLVIPEVKHDSVRLANIFLEEFQSERDKYKSLTPYEWILRKMKQIGLESYEHNFTLYYPFGGGKAFHGKNIYGFVRAPRIGSTEGIVFSTPYRPPTSVHVPISAGVPLLLAFAEYARKQNYWAKDLIFLVTDQEQLGMQAWLEAYHNGVMNRDSSFLNSGDLPSRAGALQAALNLEIQGLDVDYIDVKLEGLNGQLPNLDMFNLVQRITAREGILSGYKFKPRRKRRLLQNTFKENLVNMFEMIISQASGVPSGNHGLFHKYRIESVTLEAVRKYHGNIYNSNRLALLKILEGISRSLNNLLERFHQSYFFYILVQNDRFISIGDFMPCLVLMTSALLIKAFLLWAERKDGDLELDGNVDVLEIQQKQWRPYQRVILHFGTCAAIGTMCHFMTVNELVNEHIKALGLNTASAISTILICWSLVGIGIPLMIEFTYDDLVVLHISSLITFGTTLTVLGLLNFSLGFLLAIITVPLAIFLNTNTRGVPRGVLVFCTALLNPLVAIYIIVTVLTLFQFPELSVSAVLAKAIIVTMDAFTFNLMDLLIYKNWLYGFTTLFLFPHWILFWTLALSRHRKYQTLTSKKLN